MMLQRRCFLRVVAVALLLALVSAVFGAPLPAVSTTWVKPAINALIHSDIAVPPPEIMRFMRRFGYLEPNPSDAEALYHESAIIEAIKNVQKYGAIEQTGKLDNATLELFNKPRCGVADIEGTPYYLASSTQRTLQSDKNVDALPQQPRQRRFVIGAPTWKKRHLRYFIANWSLKIPQMQIERDIKRALALWAQFSGLHFERVNDTAADIIVGFGTRYHGDNYAFDGPGNILAHAFYPYEMGSWGGDVHFDEDEHWLQNSTNSEQGVDFYAVAVHEIGHSLGLAHSPVYNSVMFPYYKGPAGTTLDHDDTMAMYDIYLSKRLEDDDEDVLLNLTPSTTLPASVLEENTTPNIITPTFLGDYENVKNRYAFNTTPESLATSTATLPASQSSPTMRICRGSFDAVSVLNGSLYIFKNEYAYKLTSHYTIEAGFPLTIHEMYPFLPTHIRNIDAAYQRSDGAGVFFTGSTYWVFSYTKDHAPILIENSPLPLTTFVPNALRVDAVMLWPKNNYTYIFAGTKFWRYDDRIGSLDTGYPKSMRRWPGIPENIDAAATLHNGKTYFFKNNLYWLYDNVNVRPAIGYPRRASSAWLNCPKPTRTPLRNLNTTVSFTAASTAIWALSSA